MTTIAEQLSAYAAGLRYEDLQPEVVRQAKRLIVDTVGCALGGAASEPARIARLKADTVVRPHRHDGDSLPHAQDRNTMYWFMVRHPVLDLVEVIMRFALGITMLLAGMLLHSSALAQSLSRADRPELKIGDQWVYRLSDARTGEKRWEGTHVLEALTEDRIVVRTGPAGRNTYTRDWNLTEMKQGDSVTFAARPAWGYYQFPLEVGKQWDAKFDATSRGGQRTARWQWKVRVEAVESVNVPAGTFEAFKLRYEGYFNVSEGTRNWNGSRSETLWYAPAVKRHVRFEFEERATWAGGSSYDHVRVELVSSKPGP
jgi:hypothetical protein